MVNFNRKTKSLSVFPLFLIFILQLIFSVFPAISFADQTSPKGMNLPAPGSMVTTSKAYKPVQLNGIAIDPENALQFDFMINSGDTNLQGDALKSEAMKLIKYFLASLTVPEDDLWVNLSPYEEGRIIPPSFGDTEMGRDLLAQDYMLKQLTASMMYPEKDLGKEFWERVYTKARAQFGTADIPMNTFNKIWILPEKAIIYQNEGKAYIVESRLKVMLEEDYMALQNNMGSKNFGTDRLQESDVKAISGISSGVVKEVLIPEIEKEVNEGAHFAPLRQIYNAIVLATWFEKNLKQSLLGQVYVNKGKTKGVEVADVTDNQKIYDRYLEAFKTGVYNYVKEDYDSQTKEKISRKYFSGGVSMNRTRDVATRARVVDARTLDRSQFKIMEQKVQAISSSGENVAVRVTLLDAGPKTSFDKVRDQIASASSTSAVEKLPYRDQFRAETKESANFSTKFRDAVATGNTQEANRLLNERTSTFPETESHNQVSAVVVMPRNVEPASIKMTDDKVAGILTKAGVVPTRAEVRSVQQREPIRVDTSEAAERAQRMGEALLKSGAMGVQTFVVPIGGTDADIAHGLNEIEKASQEYRGYAAFIPVIKRKDFNLQDDKEVAVDLAAIPLGPQFLQQASINMITSDTHHSDIYTRRATNPAFEGDRLAQAVKTAMAVRLTQENFGQGGQILQINLGRTSPEDVSQAAKSFGDFNGKNAVEIRSPEMQSPVMASFDQKAIAQKISQGRPATIEISKKEITLPARQSRAARTPAARERESFNQRIAQANSGFQPGVYEAKNVRRDPSVTYDVKPGGRLIIEEGATLRGNMKIVVAASATAIISKDVELSVSNKMPKSKSPVVVNITGNTQITGSKIQLAQPRVNFKEGTIIENSNIGTEMDLGERVLLKDVDFSRRNGTLDRDASGRLAPVPTLKVPSGEDVTTSSIKGRPTLVRQVSERPATLAEGQATHPQIFTGITAGQFNDMVEMTSVNLDSAGRSYGDLKKTSHLDPLAQRNKNNVNNLGGIDLNPTLLDLQIRRDDNGVPLPIPQQPIQNMNIQGFLPVINNIQPIPNLPMLLGVSQEEDSEIQEAVVPAEETDPTLRAEANQEIILR